MFEPNFRIRFLHKNEGQILRFHFHNELEILMPITQGGQLWIENTRYSLSPGSLFIMDEHLLHHQDDVTIPYERYVLHIAAEELEKLSAPHTDFLRCFRDAPNVIDIQEYLPGLSKHMAQLCAPLTGEFGCETRQTINFLSLLLNISALIGSAPAVNQTEQDSTVLRVIEIQKYIQENYSRPLTLDEISAEFFISKYHLCHLFKKTSKYSVIDFLNYCRITRACALLRNQIPPVQVGEAVGFQSNVQFIRVFKQWIGSTPTQYYKRFRTASQIEHNRN